MAMDLKEIESLIKEAMPDASIEIQDLAGDGNHYSATVTSSEFSGKSKIDLGLFINDFLDFSKEAMAFSLLFLSTKIWPAVFITQPSMNTDFNSIFAIEINQNGRPAKAKGTS